MILSKTNYVDLADKTMAAQRIQDRTGKYVIKLSTSKIRKLLSMSADIYNEAKRLPGNSLNEEMKSKLQYMKMHFIYEAGRDQVVRSFIEKAKLIETIDEVGSSKEQLIVFCHYMEALVAYQRFFFCLDM